LNEKKDLHHALAVRTTLFGAARTGIKDKEKLEEFLKKKNIKFKPFDPLPLFGTMENYFREDNINATPTCVISHSDKKELYQGVNDITKALGNLK
jgi:hypothetical protein